MKLFHTTSYKLYQPQVKKIFKVAVISDLHFSYTISNEKLQAILKDLKQKHPKYILIPGDLIDSTDMIKKESERNRLIKWLTEVGKIGTTLISLGSHDYYKKALYKDNKGNLKVHWVYYYDQEFFNQINQIPNVRVLDNESYEDENIYVTGITQSFEYYHPKTQKKKSPLHPTPEDIKVMKYDIKNMNNNLIQNLSKEKVKLAMIHSPVYLTNPKVTKLLTEFDYYISGHMHNGCVPPILYELWHSTRGLIAPNKDFFPKDERNTLKKKNDKLIVNGPLTTFQECTGFMQKFNLLFPTYTSMIEFTNYETYNTRKVYVKRKYHK